MLTEKITERGATLPENTSLDKLPAVIRKFVTLELERRGLGIGQVRRLELGERKGALRPLTEKEKQERADFIQRWMDRLRAMNAEMARIYVRTEMAVSMADQALAQIDDIIEQAENEAVDEVTATEDHVEHKNTPRTKEKTKKNKEQSFLRRALNQVASATGAKGMEMLKAAREKVSKFRERAYRAREELDSMSRSKPDIKRARQIDTELTESSLQVQPFLRQTRYYNDYYNDFVEDRLDYDYDD